MNPEQAAFLQAIIQAPDDDGPRLRYADWLEERGTPLGRDRAEFIRVQCAIARQPSRSRQVEALRRRQAALFRTHWMDWMRPVCEALRALAPHRPAANPGWLGRVGRRLRGSAPPTSAGWPYQASPEATAISTESGPPRSPGEEPFRQVRFERGFVQLVELTARQLRRGERFAELCRRAPVRTLALGLGRVPPAEFLGPHLRRLRALWVWYDAADLVFGGADALLSALAQSPDLPELIELEVAHLAERVEPVAALTRSAPFRQLRSFSANFASVDQVRLVADSPNALNLRELRLTGQGCGNEAVAALAGSRHLPRLERLVLVGPRVGDTGVRSLVEGLGLPALRHLGLAGNPIGDAGVRLLAGSPVLRQLRWLNLRCPLITGQGLMALVRSGYADRLDWLGIERRHRFSWPGRLLRQRFGSRVEFG